jgi:hypothetical protein
MQIENDSIWLTPEEAYEAASTAYASGDRLFQHIIEAAIDRAMTDVSPDDPAAVRVSDVLLPENADAHCISIPLQQDVGLKLSQSVRLNRQDSAVLKHAIEECRDKTFAAGSIFSPAEAGQSAAAERQRHLRLVR